MLLLLVALAAGALFSALLPALLQRWRHRHIPGPWSLPFIGNLPDIMVHGTHHFLERCRQKYGKTFKVYLGSNMLIITADPEMARRLNYKMLNRQIGGQLRLADKDDQIGMQGLVAAKDEEWRTLRLAWQPAFQSGSLEGYASLMDSCAVQLAERLRGLGRSGQVVEMWRELGRMTLQVVGSTAYGVDFHTMPEASQAEVPEGVALMKACQTVFSAGGLTRGSVYLMLNAMFPRLPLVGWAARNFPDRRLTEFMQARKTIREVSNELISKWQAEQPVDISATSGTAANGTEAAANGHATSNGAAAAAAEPAEPLIETISATVDASSTKAAAGPAMQGADSQQPKDQAAKQGSAAAAAASGTKSPVKRAAGLGIKPGSFLGLMLSARNRSSGNHLTNLQVVAQSNIFMLAGYETTANTLSFCVYNIAAHPQAQARLLAEIDAYGRDRQVAFGDLSQFPYTEAVVRESLRLFPPATLLNREIRQGGFDLTPEIHVPGGRSVFTFVYGYQRDPDYWPAADEFRPERWLPEGAELAPKMPEAWTPFGSGPRMCVGWRFAIQEAKIALVRLYQHQTYELEPGQVPLETMQNITLSPKNGVNVRVVPRS